uniref:Uncharacterized protein n=1 Tax=Chenopodium quinoa TaxID=63459 RepID=A0A803MIA1_CHEQI
MNPSQVPITLERKIPPAYETFVDFPMEGPSMVTAHPLVNKVLMHLDTFLPPVHYPAAMLMSFMLPIETAEPMKAFLEMIPNVPRNVYDTYPLFPMFNVFKDNGVKCTGRRK